MAIGNWLSSTLLSDPKHFGGILCNEIYKGTLTWNRSAWKKHTDSGKRIRFERPASEWLSEDRPDLCIVDDDTWRKVRARIAHGSATRGRAVAAGIVQSQKDVAGKPGRYWLSGAAKCAHCHANLVADSRRDLVCPTFRFGGRAACDNDLRIRRQELEGRVFAALESVLLSEEALTHARHHVTRQLKEREAEANRQQRSALEKNAELAALDQQERMLRALPLDASAIAAAIAALDAKREEIVQRDAAAAGAPARRAERVLALLPATLAEYRKAIANGIATQAQNGQRRRLDAKFAEIAYREAVEEMRELIAGPAAQAMPQFTACRGLWSASPQAVTWSRCWS
jgi:hypothetical protein